MINLSIRSNESVQYLASQGHRFHHGEVELLFCLMLQQPQNHRYFRELNKLKFYRLPRSTELQREYTRILQTTGINWNSAYICSQHRSKGFRENIEDLPDVPAHESQIARLRIKLEKARRRNNTSLAKVLSRKIELATRLSLKPSAIQRKTPSDRGSTPLAATPGCSFASGKQDDPVTGSLLLSWKI